MYDLHQLKEVSATGNVAGTDVINGALYGVTLTAAAAASTLVLRSGGASGTVILTVAAAANTSFYGEYCAIFSPPLHATLTGSGALAYVEV